MSEMDKKSKLLEGVIPFNAFSLTSCYHHQKVAAYSYFRIDERINLFNNYPKYDFENLRLNNSFEFFSEPELESITGIHLIKKKTSSDIVTELISSINKNMPVLLAIDRFQMPHHKFAYKIYHAIHYILIIGYDVSRQKLIAIEQPLTENSNYAQMEFDFDVIARSFADYKKFISRKETHGIVKFKQIKKKNPEFKKSVITDFIREMQDEFTESNHEFTKICCYMLEAIQDKEKWIKNVIEYRDFFRPMRPKKQLEKYLCAKLFENEELNNLCEIAVETTAFICAVLEKCVIVKKCNETTAQKLTLKLIKLIEIEIEFCSLRRRLL